tara:strand:- start:228 stop:404 length:177 start_codon:yes stop_codon:yes gene_type:complete
MGKARIVQDINHNKLDLIRLINEIFLIIMNNIKNNGATKRYLSSVWIKTEKVMDDIIT